MNSLEKIESFINDRRLQYPHCRISIGKVKDFWNVRLYDNDDPSYPVRVSQRQSLDAAIESLLHSA